MAAIPRQFYLKLEEGMLRMLSFIEDAYEGLYCIYTSYA